MKGGEWTIRKLQVLEQYICAYQLALKNQSFRKVYIDLFCGTGTCLIHGGNSAVEVAGSVFRALATNPPFDEYHFVEKNAKNEKVVREAILRSELAHKAVEIHQGDANVLGPGLIRNLDKNDRVLVFIDPYGNEFAWESLCEISAHPHLDGLYLFPLEGIFRNAARRLDKVDSQKEISLDKVFPPWRELYEPVRTGDLFGHETVDRRQGNLADIAELVGTNLKKVFPMVSTPHYVYARKTPKFLLFFFMTSTSNSAQALARRIFTSAFKELTR